MALPDRFVKMAGGGNDFLVFEADGRLLSDEDRRRIALLCRRGLSVGADGALFLSAGEGSRIRLDYFNADGGLASFCANGTRCAARYAVTRGLVPKNTLVLETGWAPIAARVDREGSGDDESTVSLELPSVARPGDPIAISGAGLPATGIPALVGVPHLVVFVDGLPSLDVARLGPPLRRHPQMPDGANVNFVSVVGPDRIAVRTYERGVEAETLACGSGVVASAIVAAATGRVRAPASVVCETRSGAAFTVAFNVDTRNGKGKGDEGGGASDVRLTGDAREIFTGELTKEAWLP